MIGTDERYLKMENGTLFSTATTQLKRWYQCSICIRQGSNLT